MSIKPINKGQIESKSIKEKILKTNLRFDSAHQKRVKYSKVNKAKIILSETIFKLWK